MRASTWIAALAAVTLWGILACCLIGAGYDGSISDILTTLHLIFFMPGLCPMELVKGSHGNADLPFMAVFGWFVFTVLSILIVEGIRLIGGRSRR